MSNLSYGLLHCTPIKVKCVRNLDQIAQHLAGRLYSGACPTSGWGSITDDLDALKGLTLDRPAPSPPSVIPAGEAVPYRRLRARFYWDAAIPRRVAEADKRSSHRFNAVDVVLRETADPISFEGYITSRTDRDLDEYIIEGLRATFDDIAPGSFVETNRLDLKVDSDFYLWLLHKSEKGQRLCDDLDLEGIRTLSTKDGLSRPTSLSSGAVLARAELAAAVLGAPNKFGPASFSVVDDVLELSIEIELHPDGSYQILVGNSFYEDRLHRSVKGPRLADDAAFVVLPKLMSAFSVDLQWPNPGRRVLRDQAREVLQALLDTSRTLDPVAVPVASG